MTVELYQRAIVTKTDDIERIFRNQEEKIFICDFYELNTSCNK
jgi:hypothetical protein